MQCVEKKWYTEKFKFFHFESNDQMHQANLIMWSIHSCVTAPISIIDTFVSYVVIEKTILSNLFSQGIISNISWYGNVTRVTEMLIFLHTEIKPWKLALKVVILLLRIVLDEMVTILHVWKNWQMDLLISFSFSFYKCLNFDNRSKSLEKMSSKNYLVISYIV